MAKSFLRYILTALITAALVGAGFLFLHGIPLIGLPKPADISSVDILDRKLSGGPRTLTEEEEIVLAVKLANFLNYKPGRTEPGEAVIEVTYHMKSGEAITLSANENTVFWKGKARPVKTENGEMFIKLAEGVFFFDALVEADNGI